MEKLLGLVWCLSVFFGYSQSKEIRQLQKFLGDQYLPIPEPNKRVELDSAQLVFSRGLGNEVIGRVINQEYVQAFDTLERMAVLKPKFICASYISRGEFLEFRDWVRDSIARRKIIYGFEREEYVVKLIKKEYREAFLETSNSRDLWPLNWSYTLKYDTPLFVPYFADMYLPQPERYRKSRVFDLRKFGYNCDGPSGVGRIHPIFIDSYNWALHAEHPFDLWSVLAYLDDQLYADAPMCNIEPFMAEMYCHWKSKQLNRELHKKGLDLSVKVRLPEPNEVISIPVGEPPSFRIDAYDCTENWKITNAEFKAFSAHVLDSVTRKYLYFRLQMDKEADQLLVHPKYLFSEGNLEYMEWDPSDRYLNWEVSQLNYKAKIPDKSTSDQRIMGDFYDELQQGMYYEYIWLDAPNRAVKGEWGFVPNPFAHREHEQPEHFELISKDSAGRLIGEDFNLNSGYSSYSVLDHANYQRFIHRENVKIPLPTDVPDNEELAQITYEQALAYYNWKFRIEKYRGDETGDWLQFVFPDPEQFTRVQAGDRIVLPSISVRYDTPVFRTVVEVLPVE